MKIGYKTSDDQIRKIVDMNTLSEISKSKSLQLPFVEIDVDEDKKWNARKINAEMLQAMEQGASIDDMAAKLMKVSDMNKNSAIRNARTMTTSFENLGRLDGMKKMQENGTIVKKKWLATNDSKTRDAHAQLNGVTANVDESFKNDLGEIMYPGDPTASPANIYNCRCTLTYEIEGFEPTLAKNGIKSVHETSIITQEGKHIDLSEFPLEYSSIRKLPKEQELKILEFEKKLGITNGYGIKNEVGLLLDKQGNVLFDSTLMRNMSTPESVDIPTKIWVKGDIFTHYHPESKGGMGGTFSYDDLKAFSEANLSTMRAYAPEGTYTIIKLDNFDGQELAKHMSEKQGTAYSFYLRRKVDESPREFGKEYSRFLVSMHNELLKNQKKYGYVYYLEKWR